MKYLVRRNNSAKYGYELVQLRDDGVEVTTELKSKTTDNYLVLPFEVMGRKMLSIKAIEAGMQDDVYEVTQRTSVRATETKTPKAQETTLQLAQKYLTPEELELYTKLCIKIQNGSMIEKARKAVEAAQAEYNRLLGLSE